VRGVDDAVQDGIRECGVTHDGVPVLEGKLAREQGRPSAVPILHHLEEIASLGVGQGGQAEIIEHQELGLRQSVEELGVRAIGAGQGELAQQTCEAGRESASAGAVGECTGEITLPRPGRSRDILPIN
jgi:hypothetical protein